VVGFTLNSNESKKSEVLSVKEELALLNSTEVSSQIELLEYVDRGKMLASLYGPRFHGR
jgi:hypothetical protein